MENKKLEPVILVASKPVSTYILASERVLRESDEILLKARGKNINTLVNLAEILKRNGLKQGDIKIGTSTFTGREGKEVMVSEMEIFLKK